LFAGHCFFFFAFFLLHKRYKNLLSNYLKREQQEAIKLEHLILLVTIKYLTDIYIRVLVSTYGNKEDKNYKIKQNKQKGTKERGKTHKRDPRADY